MKPSTRWGASLLLVSCACGRSRSEPSYAYVTNDDVSSISVFRLDASSGGMELVRTVATPGGGATYCEVHPSGRFMFVSAQFANTVSTYAIDADGSATLVAGST